jgi:hypothetical protein
MPNPANASAPCPNCGESASGRFCSNCGASLKGGKCAECGTDLPAGAKFCHKCGTPTGAGAKKSAKTVASAPAATGIAAAAPWAVAGIALVALIALVASRQFSNSGAPPSDETPATMPLAGSAGTTDISSMTPRERAERLYNRIMRLDGEGKKDSVAFFSPMAIQAYQMIPDQDADTRYDMARIAELAGALPLAKAQADTILAASPTNLLGLTLAMRVSRDMGNTKDAASYGKRLRAAAPAERKKDFQGYKLHAPDLDQALKESTP